jgi:hypothetical protein
MQLLHLPVQLHGIRLGRFREVEADGARIEPVSRA